MYVRKNFPFKSTFLFSWFHLVWLTVWGTLAVSLYHFTGWHFLSIPWLPVSLIGLAVAFYQGFKNNASYDRMWEARKIWGAIVNRSRSFSVVVKHFPTSDVLDTNDSSLTEEIKHIQRRMIHRHIAWLYQLRSQLLEPRSWEHLKNSFTSAITSVRIKRMEQRFQFRTTDEIVSEFLTEQEFTQLQNYSNRATHILDQQSADISKLKKLGLIDTFQQVSMQDLITEMYTSQGQCERIKNFPFPRQYGSMSFYFVAVFIVLLPFGMLAEFEQLGEGLIFLTVPFTVIVGWVYIMMELIGDYSENPFENLSNDIPMFAITRSIEIDLLEMLGEENIPEPLQPLAGILM